MQLEDLPDLFQRTLELAWDCETHLQEEFPKLADAVQSPELRQLFFQRHNETRDAIDRLHQIFVKLERSPIAETSEPVRSAMNEAGKVIHHVDLSPLRDAALIFLVNQTAHYKIALYGSSSAFARALGRGDLASLLDATLNSEKMAGQALTALAENSINPAAAKFHNSAPFAFI